MKTSTAGKILTALAFVSMIGGLSMGTALDADPGWRQPQQNRAAYERGRHDNRGWRDNLGWRDNRGWHAYPPVYAPGARRLQESRPWRSAAGPRAPPIIYAPSPSHDISIFLPFFRYGFDVHRPSARRMTCSAPTVNGLLEVDPVRQGTNRVALRRFSNLVRWTIPHRLAERLERAHRGPLGKAASSPSRV